MSGQGLDFFIDIFQLCHQGIIFGLVRCNCRLNLAQVSSYVQNIVIGAIIVSAVYVDVASERRRRSTATGDSGEQG